MVGENIKIALVCIAKNEDNYIQEWVNYHLKLGFDKIFIYENDWNSNIENDKVTKIKISGVRQQLECYNSFIKQNIGKYDWVSFLDVDEFIVLKKHKTIKEFISNYSEFNGVGINWVLFGDNNLSDVIDNNYSVIERFTKRQKNPNSHIKSIVKLTNDFYMWVHNPSGSFVDTNKNIKYGTPYIDNGPIDVAQINHYFCKTKSEFIKKVNRGRADTGTFRDMGDFDSHNFNDIEDLNAYNFYKN